MLTKKLQQRIIYKQPYELGKYYLVMVLLKVVEEETTTTNQLQTS